MTATLATINVRRDREGLYTLVVIAGDGSMLREVGPHATLDGAFHVAARIIAAELRDRAWLKP